MSTTARAGKNGVVNINASASLELTKWAYTPETDLVDATNFTGDGAEENIMGIYGADIDVEGYYTTLAGGLLTLGATVAVTLKNGATTFLQCNAIVKTKPIENEIRGRTGMTCKLRMQGAPSTML